MTSSGAPTRRRRATALFFLSEIRYSHGDSARRNGRHGVVGVTQQDIADSLGLPLITVHRALSGTGYVSAKLRDRILGYAKEVQYVPHRASRVLVRNKVRKIALFSSALPHYFWADIRTGISIAARQIQDFHYQVNYRTIADWNTRQYLARLKEEIDDGLEAVGLVNQWIFDMKAIISTIERHGLPYVTLNVDAPDTKRLCYIGPDYPAGGRLAAEYIGKSLLYRKDPRVLVITTREEVPRDSDAPDINHLRYEAFLSVLRARFDDVEHSVGYLSTDMRSKEVGSQIEDLLAARKGRVDAIYFIPAHNTQFLQAMEKVRRGKTITVLHDLDSSANQYLEKNLLTAVIYQNPILQGYYAVKILEHILESGQPQSVPPLTITHSILLNENKGLNRNHSLFTGMLE
jgi:LacI family transcriptional regulator